MEALRIGDKVPTLLGAGAATVRWLGHRQVDCARHPRPQDVWPVRVRAGAFAADVPHRDLWLSPDHAVWLGGEGAAPGDLIPIRYLVNGASIAQQAVDEVTYWHVELARHEVILAEGLPCESYLDTGNRGGFVNGGDRVPDESASIQRKFPPPAHRCHRPTGHFIRAATPHLRNPRGACANAGIAKTARRCAAGKAWRMTMKTILLTAMAALGVALVGLAYVAPNPHGNSYRTAATDTEGDGGSNPYTSPILGAAGAGSLHRYLINLAAAPARIPGRRFPHLRFQSGGAGVAAIDGACSAASSPSAAGPWPAASSASRATC